MEYRRQQQQRERPDAHRAAGAGQQDDLAARDIDGDRAGRGVAFAVGNRIGTDSSGRYLLSSFHNFKFHVW